MTIAAPKLAYSPTEAADVTPFSRQYVMKAIHAGHLKAKKRGGDSPYYVILAADLQAWLDNLPDAD